METLFGNMDVSAKIISEVRRHPQLYDKKNPSFKFKYMKEEVWEKIGAAVSLDVPQVQTKWKNLRDQFAKEKRKQSGLGLEDHEIKWPYFESLKFLTKHVIPRNRQSKSFNLSNIETQFDHDDDCADSQCDLPINLPPVLPSLPDIQLIAKPGTELKIKKETFDDRCDDDLRPDSPMPPTATTVYGPPPLKKIKAQHAHQDENSRDEDLLTSVVDYLRTENSVMDSDVAFGKMVGERLKEIKKSKRNRLKIEITKLLYADSIDDEE